MSNCFGKKPVALIISYSDDKVFFDMISTLLRESCKQVTVKKLFDESIFFSKLQ